MIKIGQFVYAIDECGKNAISGWVLDQKSPNRHVRLNFMLSGHRFVDATADVYRADLRAAGIGNGDHSFSVRFNPPLTNEEIASLEVFVNESNEKLEISQISSFIERQQRPSVYLEISDLINFLRHEKRVTGIQRLVSQFCWSLMSLKGAVNYKFCALLSEQENKFVELNDKVLERLISAILSDVKGDELISYIDQLVATIAPLHIRAGDVLLGTGASFSFVNYPIAVKQLKESTELRYGTILYDLIPYYSRATLPPELSIRFSLWLSQISEISDFVISISDYTAKEFYEFSEQNKIDLAGLEVVSIPLGTHISRRAMHSSVRQRYFVEREFCIFVSTMETRKNHAALLHAWAKLIASNPDIPQLVLVGKQGWGFQDLKNIVGLNSALDSKVLFIHDASDSDLEWLYANCLFTIYPSLYEGWGLPVTESLARGKFSICSNTTSLPEAGGEFADYFDPHDVGSIVKTVSLYLSDRSLLAQKESQLKEAYTIRTWDDYAEDVNGFISNTVLSRPIRGVSPRIDTGKLYGFSRSIRSGENFFDFVRNRSQAYMTLGEGGWHIPEDAGRWLHGAYGSVNICLPDASFHRAHVYIKYWLAVNAESIEFDIIVNGMPARSLKMIGDELAGHKVESFVVKGGAGSLNIEFRRRRIAKSAVNEPRDLFLALLAIGVAVDADERLDILEELVLK